MLGSKLKCQRAISSAALICSIATSSYSNRNNHIAEIESWTIYIASVLYLAETKKLSKKYYNNEIEIALNIVINSLQNLLEEVKDLDHFLVDNIYEDAFIHQARITWIIGMLSALGIYYKINRSKKNEELDLITKFISKNKSHLDL